MTAVLLLKATPAQMSVLAATGSAAVLLFSFTAGALVDRVRSRPVMIGADLLRFLLLLAIPVLALAGTLSIPILIGVSAMTGLLTVLFDVAYQSFLPSLVPPSALFEGNRLLTFSSSTAETVGPALTGILVQLITAPIAILIDAVSFLISALSVSLIREPQSGQQQRPAEGVLGGLRFILRQPTLRALLLRSVLAFFSMGPIFSYYILYAIRDLHLSTSALGIAISLGGASSLLGASQANRFRSRASILGAALIAVGANALLPLAGMAGRWPLLFLCAQQLIGDSAWTVYFVNEMYLRQSLAPPQLLGRVNGAMQFASRGMLPVGALATAWLIHYFSIIQLLWFGTAGLLLSSFFLLSLFSRGGETMNPDLIGKIGLP